MDNSKKLELYKLIEQISGPLMTFGADKVSDFIEKKCTHQIESLEQNKNFKKLKVYKLILRINRPGVTFIANMLTHYIEEYARNQIELLEQNQTIPFKYI